MGGEPGGFWECMALAMATDGGGVPCGLWVTSPSSLDSEATYNQPFLIPTVLITVGDSLKILRTKPQTNITCGLAQHL